MCDEAPDQRKPKLVTMHLPSLKVNRKWEREREIVFFPLIHFFPVKTFWRKWVIGFWRKSSILEQKINPLSSLTSTILRTEIILGVESSVGRECSSHLRKQLYAKILAKTHFGWNTEILAKTRNFFMFDEAPDQRVPKLVTVRLSSLEVNRKSERNSVFPIEYIFFQWKHFGENEI